MLEKEKASFLSYLRKQYSRGNRREKGELLREVEEHLGVGRRQARRLLSPQQVGRPRKPKRAGRKGKYQDADFKQALREVWRAMRYMCSRHIKASISEWLPFIEQSRQTPFREDIRERLLQISPPTIDRILKPYKAIKGKSLTRPGGFRDEIPIQTNIWDTKLPGFLEADTVGHCGGSTMGEYLHSFTMVDIATIWSEVRSIFGKGSFGVIKALEEIERALPFPILGYDTDNGTELLNQHTLRYFRDERIERNLPPVQVTRSREYHKNDQAHVEQRNDSIARRWLGYERLDFAELQPLVNYYYAFVVCPLMNHFFPTFKLHEKRLIKARRRRIYQEPVTPYQRVMNADSVSDEHKARLSLIHQQLNPIELLKQERILRRQIDSALTALRQGRSQRSLLTPPPIPPWFVQAPVPAMPLHKPRLSGRQR